MYLADEASRPYTGCSNDGCLVKADRRLRSSKDPVHWRGLVRVRPVGVRMARVRPSTFWVLLRALKNKYLKKNLFISTHFSRETRFSRSIRTKNPQTAVTTQTQGPSHSANRGFNSSSDSGVAMSATNGFSTAINSSTSTRSLQSAWPPPIQK
jgi:hypothetical protein